MINELQNGLPLHHLPLITLGSGRTTLLDKFQTLVHAFALESGGTCEELARYCSQIRVITSDFGVEFSLSRVRPAPVRTLIPWYKEDLGEVSEGKQNQEEWEVDSPAEVDAPAGLDTKVSIEEAIPTPGLLHIIHNATNSLLDSVPELEEIVEGMATICTFLREPYTCARLVDACFCSIQARPFQEQLKRFDGKVNRARWGSLAFACSSLLSLERPLREHWNLEAYQKGDQNSEQRSSPATAPGNLQQIDEAIESSEFWAKLQTLNCLFELVRSAFEFAEGCCCHGSLDRCGVSSDVCLRWDSCPLRGLRLPEVAAGDFYTNFEALYGLSAAQLLLSLPPDVDASVRSQCLLNFERGRIHLMFNFTLKLCGYMEPPCLLFGVAHHDLVVARRIAKVCLGSSSTHPQMSRFQATPLREEVNEFIDGTDFRELPVLHAFMAEMRFGHASERLVEGGHARVNLLAGRSRNRSEAYDSLLLRMPEIKRKLKRDPQFLTSLLTCLASARSPRSLTDRLNLGNHPSLDLATDSWDPIFRKVIFRADPHSLYRARARGVEVLEFCPVAAPKDVPAVVGPAETDIIEGGTATEPDIYQALKHDAAIAFLKRRVEEDIRQGKYMYSCELAPMALRSLMTLLAPSSSKDSAVSRRWDAWNTEFFKHADAAVVGLDGLIESVQVSRQVWLSIVDAAPHRAKRALPGDLRSGDIGVAVHRFLGCDTNNRIVFISPDAHSHTIFDASSVGETCPATVFTPRCLPLESLMRMRRWDSKDGIRLSVSGITSTSPELAHDLLTGLTSGGSEGYRLHNLSEGQMGDAREMLQGWKTAGLLSHDAGPDAWSLTEDGRARVCSSMALVYPKLVLQVRDIQAADMDRFELLLTLEMDGWSLCCAEDRRSRGVARSTPYLHGKGLKRWWCRPSDTITDIPRLYLVMLVSAEKHGLEVPHLLAATRYAKLLDTSSEPKPKRAPRLRTFKEMGDWDPDLHQPKRKRARQQTKAKTKSWCVPKSSGSSRSSASSRSSSSSSSEGSSSSSGSSSGAPALAPVSPRKQGKVQEHTNEASGQPRGGRQSWNRESFGIHFLTARFSPQGLSGWQMTCARGNHAAHTKCTKEISIDQAGGNDEARRFLKAWVLLGSGVASRSEHMSTSWKAVLLSAIADGTLMSEAELDVIAMQHADSEVQAPFVEVPTSDVRTVKKRKSSKKSGVLGACAKGVPSEIHIAMEALTEQGVLPPTTPEQRSRNSSTANTTYGVPKFFSEAKQYGYVHPNLPPPGGYKWVCRSGKWLLIPRGG